MVANYMDKEELLESKVSILKEIAETIVSTDNIYSITNLIIDLTLTYTKAKSGSIMLLNEAGELTVKASRGMDSALAQTLRVKVGEEICGKVAMERAPILVKDIELDERLLKKCNARYETKSFISCPILIKDKLLGVINLSDKADGTDFTEDEFDLVNILANQAAVALENANLMSELKAKAIELDELNKWLMETDRLKTEFVARISHELRTPLNSVRGAVYYLKEKKNLSKSEQTEFMDIISNESGKLNSFIEDLLDYSRLAKEENIINKRALDINNVINDAILTKTVKDVLKERKVSVGIMCSEGLPMVVGDRTRIIQMFINIIEGIAKYAMPADLIEIRCSVPEPSVEIELFIKNREIPHEELPFIFNSRMLWARPAIEPDSFKFYLAKKTVELHKGSISAQNVPTGLSVKILIPTGAKEKQEAEVNELMNLFISFITESMDITNCSLMLADELTGELTIRAAQGIDEETIRSTKLRYGDRIAGWVAMEGKPLLIEDIEKDLRFGKKNIPRYNTKSLLSLPLFLEGKVIGVLNLNNKADGSHFDEKDLYIARVIAERTSCMIENLYKGRVKDNEFMAIIEGMESLITAITKYKKKNGIARDLILKTMRQMNCPDNEIGLALYASALYDLGITQVQDSILNKSSRLSTTEQKIIRTHSFSAIGLINHIGPDEVVKKIILHHHERYDGSGYPDGLKGEEIPFISRVLAVVDTYAALTSERPHRKALSKEEAADFIKSGSGAHFDPKAVDAFLKVVQ